MLTLSLLAHPMAHTCSHAYPTLEYRTSTTYYCRVTLATFLGLGLEVVCRADDRGAAEHVDLPHGGDLHRGDVEGRSRGRSNPNPSPNPLPYPNPNPNRNPNRNPNCNLNPNPNQGPASWRRRSRGPWGSWRRRGGARAARPWHASPG